MISISLLCLSCLHTSMTEEVHFDFDDGDLQGWAVMEGEFDALLTDRGLSRNRPGTAYPKPTPWFLSTTECQDGGYNDAMTGVIESPVFILSDSVVQFYIGGGSHADTYVALFSKEGIELQRAHGGNDEIMHEVVWDVSDHIGKPVYLAIVDHNTGPFGHVTFAHFRASGRIDWHATQKVRETYAQRKEAMHKFIEERMAKWDIEREEQRVDLSDPTSLFALDAPRVYQDARLDAICLPLGGIGAGVIQINGKAELDIWQIFNNYLETHIPHSFFAARVQMNSGHVVTRALQTSHVGPFEAMERLTFEGAYPFGQFRFEDSVFPLTVTLEAFSPLIPMETRDSSWPCAVFTIDVFNPSTESVEVTLLASQQNAVGFSIEKGHVNDRNHPDYGGNRNQILTIDNATLLHMTSDADPNAPGYGDMVLMAIDPNARGAAEWENLDALHDMMHNSGGIAGPLHAGPSNPGETLDGVLSVSFSLAPEQRRSVPFALLWNFPNAVHGLNEWGGKGNRYAVWWPDALSAAKELATRLPDLRRSSRAYIDALYESNLPHWFIDRISSQVAVLRSKTCYWTRDGYFGGFEGCGVSSGCCAGNCSHVWHYAQAHARLFPELARIIREQEFAHQYENGGIPHRQLANVEPATDGHLGAILGAYREHLCSHDGTWLHEQWPAIRNAMDFAITTWDPDEDGVLGGRQWNTLDEALGGSTSWMGTLYLAALAACEQMAELMEEPDAVSRYCRIRESGTKRQDDTLFNGEFYIQIPDEIPMHDYGPGGCHIDQLLGEWWARQVGIAGFYDEQRARVAMQTLFANNFKGTFHGILQVPRKFVADYDPGMQMITWPGGDAPAPEHRIFYGDEVMSGFEYAAAALMIHLGLLQEGFTVVRAVAERYDGRLRTGLTPGDTASWGYSGNPFGDDECGKFYARAISSWSLLIAVQGFQYNGPAGMIGFNPIWKPEDHVSFFTTAEGWGVYHQTQTVSGMEAYLDLRYGQLHLSQIRLELPEGCEARTVSIQYDVNLSSRYVQEGKTVIMYLDDPVCIEKHTQLHISIPYDLSST